MLVDSLLQKVSFKPWELLIFGRGLAFEVLWQLWIWSLDAIHMVEESPFDSKNVGTWLLYCYKMSHLYLCIFIGFKICFANTRGWRLVFEVSPNWSKYYWFNKDVIFWLYHCWKKLDWDLWGWKMALKVLPGDWR